MKKLFRYEMPYCIERNKEGNYVVLNRDYKPLGFNVREWSKYSEYPILHKLKGLTPEIAAQISHERKPDNTYIYLYDDGTVPTDSEENMKNYMERLELLMQLFVEE
jgi:hypothetical protein